MSTIKILVVEDELLYATSLEILIEELGYECTSIVDNAIDALQSIQLNIPDLILMDINIEGSLDGIQLAEKINSLQTIPILFITSLQDDATFERAKKQQPYAFISKPFDQHQLQRTIELVISKLSTAPAIDSTKTWQQDVLFKDCFFIKSRQQLAKVKFEDIYFIQVEKHHSTIVTANKKHVVKMSLSYLLQKLPKTQFLQTHRSFIVNATQIDAFDLADSVVMVKGYSVALSRNYKQQVLEKLDYLL